MKCFLDVLSTFCFVGVTSTSATTVLHQWKRIFTIVRIVSTS
jgi:hypothetical protein